eukprot:c20881_g3_i1 orf=183-830(+)
MSDNENLSNDLFQDALSDKSNSFSSFKYKHGSVADSTTFLQDILSCNKGEGIEMGELHEENNPPQGGETTPKPHLSVSFYKLFSFADALDYVLMFFGMVGASVHGASIPIFFIFFGKLIDAFGSHATDPDAMAKEVAKYALYFLYLGLAVLVSAWLEVSCWMLTGERQSGRMRIEYLKAMLNQDVGYFDVDISTGEIVSRISSDTALVQDAISEK